MFTKTEGEVELTFDREQIAPTDSEQRVRFLQEQGVLPATVSVTVRALLIAWAKAGAKIKADGEIELGFGLKADIEAAVIAWLREKRRVPSEFCANEVLTGIAQRRLDKAQKEKQAYQERRARQSALLEEVRALDLREIMTPKGEMAALTCSPPLADIIERCVFGKQSIPADWQFAMPELLELSAQVSNVCTTTDRRAADAVVQGQEALRDWFLHRGAYLGAPANALRAVREGIKVKREIYEFVREQLALRLGSALAGAGIEAVVLHPDEVQGDEEDNRVPRVEAYALFDAVGAAQGGVLSEINLPRAAIIVGPFVRINVAKSGNPVYRAGFRVTLHHTGLPTEGVRIYVLTEALQAAEPEVMYVRRER